MLALAAPRTSLAQDLVVYYQGAQLQSGGTVFIDKAPSMPALDLYVANGCGTVNYSINMQWTSPAGADSTSGSISGSFACGQTASADWSQLSSFEGGSATINWQLTQNNGSVVSGPSLSFNIHGMNPDNSQVDQTAANPWFFESMVAWESRAYSLNPVNQYHQFKQSGLPLDCECPHGAGLAQIDPKMTDADFWEWQQNLDDGEITLNSKAPYATSFFTNAYNAMLQNTGGNPVNPPPTSPGPYCYFTYPAGAGHNFSDANLIKEYNAGQGTAYVFWRTAVKGVSGSWYTKDTSAAYVQHVCSSAPL